MPDPIEGGSPNSTAKQSNITQSVDRDVRMRTTVICLLLTAAVLVSLSMLGQVFAGNSGEPDHYLFPARVRRGHPNRTPEGYDPASPAQSWRTAWRELTKAADLKGLRFHDLRHHCITKLGEAGVPEETLMAIAGHVSRQMLEHYSHHRIQAKRAAVAALEPKKAVEPAASVKVN